MNRACHTLFGAAAMLVALGAAAAHAVPLTYTVTFTEDDGWGGSGSYSSTGTATFTIDSAYFSPGFNALTLSSSDISNFSATFSNVGDSGNTVSYGPADLTTIFIGTDTSQSVPVVGVFLNSADTSIYNPDTSTYSDANTYMDAMPGELPQTLQNDGSGLAIFYDQSIDGPSLPVSVPEPASLALLLVGCLGLGGVRRRR